MNRKLVFALLIVVLLFYGCAQQSTQLVGNDTDSHGCKASAGYSWCEANQKCIRQWEEKCTNLRIITEDFPPENFRNSTGQISGRSTAVVQGILKRLNQTADIELMEFSSAYSLLLSGPNVAFYSAGKNPEREDKFKWAGPIGEWEMTLYAQNSSSELISSFSEATDDAEKLEIAKRVGKICVVKDDVRQQYLVANNFTNIDAVSDDGVCAAELASGQAGLWFGSSTSFEKVVGDEHLSTAAFWPVYDVGTNELYIAFSKDVPDSVVSSWQNALDDMKADGTFEAIHSNAGPQQEQNASLQPTAAPSATGLATLPAHVPPHLNNCTYSGTWDSDYGPMVFTQTGSTVASIGANPSDIVNGTMIDGVFVGTWTEPPSPSEPNDTGDVVFYFANDCNSFSGVWSYGLHLIGAEWDGTWGGNKTSASEPAAPSTAALPTHLNNCAYGGAWNSDWGAMNITQTGSTVSGTYEHDSGRLSGTVIDGMLVGKWSEFPSYSEPNDAGDAVLYFTNGCNSFSGTWNYGQHPSGASWSGIWVGTKAP